jgi:hypothetical protein
MKHAIIISRLIQKYERSKHLTQPGSSKRRVMLNIAKKELPEYEYENADIRDSFNQEALSLEQQGLIHLEWLKGRPVLSAIILNLDAIDRCYTIIDKIPPQKLAESVAAFIEMRVADVSTPWIRSWGTDTCAAARESFRIPHYCKEDLTFLSGLLDALLAYDGLHGESTTMRAFSTRCYQDSKQFERVFRDEFLRIASQYNQELFEICQQQELGVRDKLAFLGIYARPELYEFSGKCSVCTKKGVVDISPLYPFGIALPSTLVKQMSNFCLDQIQKVIFIENKTNYDEYLLSEIQPDELVFYHGGFLSPQKRAFLKVLAQSLCPETKVLFWADIDLGGFQMFFHLQAIFPGLVPMRMGAKEVRKYKAMGLTRSDEYLDHLAGCLQERQYSIFSDAIHEILACKATIEQEAFL